MFFQGFPGGAFPGGAFPGGAFPGGAFPGWPQAPQGPPPAKLYETLELPPTANTEEVRKAYRRLAVLHHPDKGGDAEKFKEISQAYEALTSPQKREAEGAPSDLFSRMFNGRARARTPDVVRDLEVTLEEIYTGVARRVEIERTVLDGAAAPSNCTNCHGSGQTCEVRQLGAVMQQIRTPCRACSGAGKSFASSRRTEALEVHVPRGAPDGARVAVAGKADEQPNSDAGDAVFVLRLAPHPEFRRLGADLYAARTVTLLQALCGAVLRMQHLDGRELVLRADGLRPARAFEALQRRAPVWERFAGSDCPGLEVVGVAESTDPEVLQRACEGELRAKGLDVSAFVVAGGRAHFFRGSREEASAARAAAPGKTLYLVAAAERLRLQGVRGEGLPVPSSCARGDLFIEVDVAFPAELTEAQRAAMRECLGPEPDGGDCDGAVLETLDPAASFELNKRYFEKERPEPAPQQSAQCQQQ